MTTNNRILWVDDEIDLLKAHRIFLKNKGFEVSTATNGHDAIEMLGNQRFDIIFLDENMPGMSGLDTLSIIKELTPDTPVVMVTKSEEENIMEQAIGSKIADYIIKPVNPSQLLLCVKKNIDSKRLIEATAQTQYQSQFRNIALQTMECRSFDDWASLYSKLVYWELELQSLKTLDDIQLMQKSEANLGFAKFVRNNYTQWLAQPDDAPLTSNRLMSQRVLPLIDDGHKVALIVIDNLRLDQWETIRPMLAHDFSISTELYCSILPTATQYARNAIFAGLMPSQIADMYPQYWQHSDDEQSQNKHENELIGTFFARYRRKDISYGYYKVNDTDSGNRLNSILSRYTHNHLNAFVYNFVDMLSHARTDIKMVKELSADDAAYRSITKSWFAHSPLYQTLLTLRDKGYTILLTTDHGTIKVRTPQKVMCDRNQSNNLRFKTGKQVSYSDKDIFEIKSPEAALLPRSGITSSYIFATGDSYFIYPNSYNQYADMFFDTLQHGGISMEEMIIPLATLTAK